MIRFTTSNFGKKRRQQSPLHVIDKSLIHDDDFADDSGCQFARLKSPEHVLRYQSKSYLDDFSPYRNRERRSIIEITTPELQRFRLRFQKM